MDESTSVEQGVAIVGMAGRFPGAANIQQFWENLRAGVESIRFLSDDELIAAGVPRRTLDDPSYVKACPVLEGIDKFDAAFFGMSPREASIMDPAHRFFLEVAWEALEHSGNTGLHEEGTVGVFAASGAPYYYMDHVRTNPILMNQVGEFLARHTGNDMNFLATRASYQLDLRGPSVNIQTACSSALAALHYARVALLRGECDLALAGASTILVPPNQGYKYQEGEILSPDGHCRPFDHRSAGTVFGSGTGCFVLKRLSDALDQGDTIYAVVKGTALNNDGALKVGYLAPGVEKQVEVVRAALAEAKIPADSLCYVETHGTGTSVGDPIELTALREALSTSTNKRGFCGVGSVKSNIGHLGEAAATASLAKVIMAMRYKEMPATLGFERPNPQLELDSGPLYIVDRLQRLPATGPVRCGINALGAGGTNVHAILEEPPPPLVGEGARRTQLLILSAKTRNALDRQCERLAVALEIKAVSDLADAAYTLALGRRSLEYRRVLTASSVAEAIEKLKSGDTKSLHTSVANTSTRGVVFTFPGGGAQYAGMGHDLYQSVSVYREAMDECFRTIDQELDVDLKALLYAPEQARAEATKRLEDPVLSLPALFATEYALARLFESWGVRAVAMVGHSMGEYVAACLAGVFSVHDGLRLVAVRGRLFGKTQRGSMVALSLSEQEVKARLPAGLSIAAVNAPQLCVASGPNELVERFKEELTRDEIDWTAIHIDVAAHSSMLEPILGEFREFCEKIEFKPPTRPVASNLTGGWLTPEQAIDPEYWVQHLRNTVRFADCVETVQRNGSHVFLEVGPGRTLTTLAGAQSTKVSHSINSVRHYKEEANDLDYALMTLGKVWASGAGVDWTAFYQDQLRNRIPLPTYPFEPTSYWIEPGSRGPHKSEELSKRESINDWFYTPSWQPVPLISEGTPATNWLIVSDDEGAATELGGELRAEGAGVVVAAIMGKALRRNADRSWRFDPGNSEHIREILETLDAENVFPQHVVLAVGMETSQTADIQRWVTSAKSRLRRLNQPDAEVTNEQTIYRDFVALVHLTKVLVSVCEACQLSVVTSQAFAIGDERIVPERRLLCGPILVFPRESPELKTRFIDCGSPRVERRIAAVVRELRAQSSESTVVLRGERRWASRIIPTPLPEQESQALHAGLAGLGPGSVVVITGGLGGIGLVVARHLAQCGVTRIALLSRTRFPARSEWIQLVESEETSPALKDKLRAVQEIEASGARALCVSVDVTQLESVQRAADEIQSQWGQVNALVHAAGLIDDGPYQTKSMESMLRVLAPKVIGTKHLESVFGPHLQLFLLFSSVASFLGLPGQVDYAAANAFLDAVADRRAGMREGRTVVVNWNAWRDVGMVTHALRSTEVEPWQVKKCRHPWLSALGGGRGSTFGLDLSPQSHWLLSEHRIKGGMHLIPGTGFVELMRAAHAELNSSSPVELSEVRFLTPFQVAADKSRRLVVELMPTPRGHAAVVRSQPERIEHASAQVRVLPMAQPAPMDLGALAARCSEARAPLQGDFLDQEFVDFGPRWGNIKQIRTGVSEAMIELELPEEFSQDLEEIIFHPALMDMATGAAQHLIPGFNPHTDFYVPFAYEAISIFSRLVPRVVSHVRLNPASMGDLAVFDIMLCDTGGRVLMTVNAFTMKRARHDAAIVQIEDSSVRHASHRALEALLREAISPDEGVSALTRVLSQNELSQVVVSSVDVNLWLKQLAAGQVSEDTASEETSAAFARPELGTEYVTPQGSIEECLAEMWSKMLGVEKPGAVDDFFELGGDSLIAVRLFAKIKKQLGVSIPISTLFQAPTIRALAELLVGKGVEVDAGKRVEDPSRKKFVPFSALREERAVDAVHKRPPGLYRSGWQETDSLPEVAGGEGGRCWLIFVDDLGLGRLIKQRLGARGDTVVLVRPGDGYSRNTATDYVVAPEKGRGCYELLLADLVKDSKIPTDILHMWLVTRDESFRRGGSFFHRTQEEGCFSLLSLAQAIADLELDVPLNLILVTNSINLVTDQAAIHDSKATSLGVLDCIPLELPRIRTRHVDLERLSFGVRVDLGLQLAETFKGATSSDTELKRVRSVLLSEILMPHQEGPILLSRGQRFREDLLPVVAQGNKFRLPSSGRRMYCLLGVPTPLVVELAIRLASTEEATIVWLMEEAQSMTRARDVADAQRRFKDCSLVVLYEPCDTTNRENVANIISSHVQAGLRLEGAVLCAASHRPELMQLYAPGAAEEELAEQVQAAQILTSLAKEFAALAFVLLVGYRQHVQPVAGEVTRRSGGAFLASHARKCRQNGQNVVCLFEETLAERPSPNEAFQNWPEWVVEGVLDSIFASYSDVSHLWAVSGAERPTLPTGEQQDGAPISVLPSNRVSTVEPELMGFFRDAFGSGELHAYSSLSSLGATRLDSARIATHIRNHYRLPQPVSALMRYHTPAQFAALVENRVEEEIAKPSFRYLVPIHPDRPGTGIPFFLVAGMFGNILNLRHLGRLLGVDRAVFGVQARGLYGDEKPHRTIEEMAEAYLLEVKQVLPKGPYLLGGFSGGGLVAFEMAKRLRREGEEVPIVVMLDTPLPQRPQITYRDRLMLQRLSLQRKGLRYVGEWAVNRVSWELDQIRERFHETDKSYSPGEYKYDTIQEAFLAAAARYQVGTYAGKVVLYRPALDRAYEVAPGRFINSSRELVLDDQGWSPYVAEVEVREVPGDHDHMVLEPEVRVLASLVRKKLADIDLDVSRGSAAGFAPLPVLDF